MTLFRTRVPSFIAIFVDLQGRRISFDGVSVSAVISVEAQAAEQISSFNLSCQEGFFPAWGTGRTCSLVCLAPFFFFPYNFSVKWPCKQSHP